MTKEFSRTPHMILMKHGTKSKEIVETLKTKSWSKEEWKANEREN